MAKATHNTASFLILFHKHSRLIIFCLFLTVGISCRKGDAIDKKITPGDFLSDKRYEKLIVEIQYVNGYNPTSAAVANLKNFLLQHLNKKEGITIVENGIPSPGKSVYSIEDVKEIEKENRTQHTKRKTLTAYFFFADADYAGNSGSKVLGIAYGPVSMVIFEKTIQDLSGGLTQPPVQVLESSVIHHEFGHILGLVNNGTTMQTEHQDEPHGQHCDDKNCLMYYAVETSDITANILGGNIPVLDTYCMNDLKANGGK